MARQIVVPPTVGSDRGPPLFSTPELGDSWSDAIIKLNAMTAELYGGVAPYLDIRSGTFGAAGNGIADDTSAVQAAFNAAAAQHLPLLVVGGGVYAIDSVTIPSNLTVLGDGNTAFLLRANAAGSMFVWRSSATTTNVSIDNVILNGNIANQSGAPHNLLHSIFYDATAGTATVTNSSFTRLNVLNIDGSLFTANNGGIGNQFTDCLFRDITITGHSQDAIDLQCTRCLLDRIKDFNASNTMVRADCNGVSVTALDSIFRDIKVTLTTTSAGGAQLVGFSLTAPTVSTGNCILDAIDVDCGSVTNNFGFSIFSCAGVKMSNLISRNCIYNTDFEFLTVIDSHGSNLSSVNSCASGSGSFGLIFNACLRLSIDGYSYSSPANIQDFIAFQSGCFGIEIVNYTTLNGTGISLNAGNDIRLVNGYMKTPFFSGSAVIRNSGANSVNRVLIDGLSIDGGYQAFSWNNMHDSTIDNVVQTNMSVTSISQNANCSNISYGNLDGFSSLFANLPPSSPIGQTAYITDGKASNCGDAACTTFGTTVTGGGGALNLKLWWNGANWTLIGR